MTFNALTRFVCGTPSQLNALNGMQSMNDLFDRVRKDALRYTPNQPSTPYALYKRHLLHFLNHRCRGVYIDLPKLMQEKVVCISGVYPNQIVELLESPRAEQCCLGDDLVHRALRMAMKAIIPEAKEQCPLSSMPFQDPVSTIHGQVYEREAIEAWFRHSRTDPMTGERLLTTALF